MRSIPNATSRPRLLAVLSSVLCVAAATAQCAPQWVDGMGAPGAFFGSDVGSVAAATLWDPDGPGPESERLVVAGSFEGVGATRAASIACRDPLTGTWQSLATDPQVSNAPIHALATLPDGRLVAAGEFSAIGGVAASRIAAWDGSSWAPLGGGISGGSVFGLAVLSSGALVAGGSFTTAGGAPASRIARWDGAAWSQVGGGVGSTVRALLALPSGDLVAGGLFTTAGGAPANRIARWDGSAWHALGSGCASTVFALGRLASGDLVAGGAFTTAGGIAASKVARWDGSAWSGFGTGMNAGGTVYALAVLPGGDLVAGGEFVTAGGGAARNLARWNGTTWQAYGSGVDSPLAPSRVQAITVLGVGDLYVGGGFTVVDGRAAFSIARYAAGVWSSLAPGCDGAIHAMAVAPNGDRILAGDFRQIGSTVARSIARWDGSNWQPLGGGLDGPVRAVCVLPNGDVLAGGEFFAASAPAFLARWDGAAWLPLYGPHGVGVNGPVRALALLPGGSVAVGGSFTAAGTTPAGFLQPAFGLARWSGSNWATFPLWGSGTITDLAVRANGDLVVAGQGLAFVAGGNTVFDCVARWDGAAWHALGDPVAGSGIFMMSDPSLATAANGDVLLAGTMLLPSMLFTTGALGRWDGAAWTELGSTGLSTGGDMSAVVVLPDGDIVVGGDFEDVNGVSATGLARLRGATWSPVGGGLTRWTAWPGSTPGLVSCLQFLPDGTLWAGGDFLFAGAALARNLAEYVPACPATVASAGAGCPGPGGSNTLTAVTLPWVDTTLVTTGTGLPAPSFVLAVTSVTPVVPGLPLASVFAEALPGCDLRVSPDILDLLVCLGGTAQLSMYLPNTPPLVGVTFYQQMVPIEIDAGLAFLSITATNALALTAGIF
ncbi:MAG: delta-60 repeat domain-containing protein [Planctomycetes bacterium]|nr:delta-60 repeat domain-containing protein [Planctomycetota bacterium]